MLRKAWEASANASQGSSCARGLKSGRKWTASSSSCEAMLGEGHSSQENMLWAVVPKGGFRKKPSWDPGEGLWPLLEGSSKATFLWWPGESRRSVGRELPPEGFTCHLNQREAKMKQWGGPSWLVNPPGSGTCRSSPVAWNWTHYFYNMPRTGLGAGDTTKNKMQHLFSTVKLKAQTRTDKIQLDLVVEEHAAPNWLSSKRGLN